MATNTEIILDNKGNIDQKVLEKSLRSALDFDVKYKQRDNMKKRACKVAVSYDEFKAMVDCAHLKKLSRSEIESLGSKKQGWGKATNPSKTVSTANILSSELSGGDNSEQRKESALKKLSGSRKIIPKTPLELSRDLRRILSDADRIT